MTTTTEQEFLIAIRVSAQAFRASQPHSSQLANYLATFASSKFTNPEQFTTTLSAVLNRLLEAISPYQQGEGELLVTVSRLGSLTGISLEVALDDQYKSAFVKLAGALSKSDPRQLYRQQAKSSNGGEPDATLALLQIANDYRALLEVAEPDGRHLCKLLLKVDLEREFTGLLPIIKRQ